MDPNDQHTAWEKEHQQPSVLPYMDQTEASSGVTRFYDWLVTAGDTPLHMRGLEMGCGKGRNSVWLAQQGAHMSAFDFSHHAIEEAQRRAQEAGVGDRVDFLVHDATAPWPYTSDTFDFAIDCFASTDIVSASGRLHARDEMLRVLKPSGYLFVYTLSTDDAFHKEMIEQHSADEPNSFTHPSTGKFEKVFSKEELVMLYENFVWLKEERVKKQAEFFGKTYACKHFWLVLQKK